MSLFKSREFWSTACDPDEEFDHNSLKICKLNGASDFALVSSHSGVLRIFKPSTEIDETGRIEGFKPSDLCIEKNLNFPVLQIDTGRLVSGSPLLQIAVLHPRSFAVYSFSTKEGVTEHGDQNMINLLYDHKLNRSAANFIIGPFGGSQNRDFIAVQSLDGMLSFFEQETFVFCCFLPNFLLPFPFTYSSRTDSFIITGSHLHVTSYSYKTLSSIGQNSNENDVGGLRFEADWSVNLSETVLGVEYLHDGFSRESFVLVLGERNLFCLSDNGKLKFMKRFEYAPRCFTTYLLGDNKVMSLVVSETSTLLLYQNTSLRWSAKLPNLPVAISRGSFRNLRGCLVSLSEFGEVKCAYLGTQPSLFSAPPLLNQELNYEEAEAELTTLNKIIKSAYNTDVKLMNKNAERELAVSIDVDPHLIPNTYETNLQQSDSNQMCLITIHVLPQAVLEEISICLNVSKPFRIAPQSHFYHNLTDRASFTCHVYLGEEAEIVSLDLVVVASCISNLGMPKVIKKVATLPMSLGLKTCTPMKENSLKITLNISESSVPLSTIFPEYIGENSLNLSSNAVSFANVSGLGYPVTILLAKSSQRYRLQSDSLAALNICVKELVRRLRKHFASSEKFAISFSSSLPVAQLVPYVNEHFEYRRKVKYLENELVQLGAQFRIIQKRLISKFKDKNPTPLTNLDMLLSDTYNETLTATANLQKTNLDLTKSQVNLSCALHLILTLIQLMEGVKDGKLVENALAANVADVDGQNWEDVLDANLNFLLRTVLAKSEKDRLRAPHISFEEVKDLGKVEKHLGLVLERLCKQGEMEEQVVDDGDGDEEISGVVEEDRDLLPMGSRLGESSTRMLSARKSLLRRRQKVVED